MCSEIWKAYADEKIALDMISISRIKFFEIVTLKGLQLVQNVYKITQTFHTILSYLSLCLDLASMYKKNIKKMYRVSRTKGFSIMNVVIHRPRNNSIEGLEQYRGIWKTLHISFSYLSN